mmetsp:Transcript_36512/g.100752  ORF Transcript_36512/g.100752 Transcript_36512/m.100752 type:complete len:323 (-) Transcript_36512:44-1012(-)
MFRNSPELLAPHYLSTLNSARDLTSRPSVPHAQNRPLARRAATSLGRQALRRRLADAIPDLLRDRHLARCLALRRRQRRLLARDADVRPRRLDGLQHRGGLGVKVVDEHGRVDGDERVPPVLRRLLRLALAQHRAARQHAGEHLDAQGETRALVAAKRRDRATLERLRRVGREARAVRLVRDLRAAIAHSGSSGAATASAPKCTNRAVWVRLRSIAGGIRRLAAARPWPWPSARRRARSPTSPCRTSAAARRSAGCRTRSGWCRSTPCRPRRPQQTRASWRGRCRSCPSSPSARRRRPAGPTTSTCCTPRPTRSGPATPAPF